MFQKVYKEVFDANGNIKPCGRMKCKELIMLASQIDKNTDFGNSETGFMNVENIKKLKEQLK